MSSAYFWLLFAFCFCIGMVSFGQGGDTKEQVVRKMVAEAVSRFNEGDATVVRDLWDEDADYVGVDGTMVTGRAAIEEFLGHILKANAGRVTQKATIERLRFIAPDIVLVDGTWTITGALDADGNQLPPIEGRGLELVKKKNGRWRFVATREMVIWKG